MPQALSIIRAAYASGDFIRRDALNALPTDAVRIASSNDDAGSGGWSFAPSEIYRLPDGSAVLITCSLAEQV